MAIQDRKFAESDFIGNDISSLPVDPSASGMSAVALQAAFDKIGKNMIALDKFNGVIDDLISYEPGASGADNIGLSLPSGVASTVQHGIDSLRSAIVESGGGDMLKQEYDSDNTGSVDNADRLGGITLIQMQNMMHPVGSIYMTTINEEPSVTLGFGTWGKWGQGRVPVCVADSGTFSGNPESTGGAEKHLLSHSEMPQHSHTYTLDSSIYSGFAGTDVITANKGGNTNNTGTTPTTPTVAHNNLQPYITCYMWKRLT